MTRVVTLLVAALAALAFVAGAWAADQYRLKEEPR